MKTSLFQIHTQEEFERQALETFHFQVAHCAVYRAYVSALGIDTARLSCVGQIPFLPIQFFKNQTIVASRRKISLVFGSSGTTGTSRSFHHVVYPALYRRSLVEGFRLFYGEPQKYCFLALLPSYIERGDSSLVYMLKTLMDESGHPDNGFFISNMDKLASTLTRLEKQGQKVFFTGVTWALLEFSARYPVPLRNTIILETGGMKGHGKELTRGEVHQVLSERFDCESVHSEYGMTELLSQAYSQGSGVFRCPPWMQIRIRDPYDPFSPVPQGRSGGINVIDLANRYSCSFVETADLGVMCPKGGFEVLGRFDHSDIRGCNLLSV